MQRRKTSIQKWAEKISKRDPLPGGVYPEGKGIQDRDNPFIGTGRFGNVLTAGERSMYKVRPLDKKRKVQRLQARIDRAISKNHKRKAKRLKKELRELTS